MVLKGGACLLHRAYHIKHCAQQGAGALDAKVHLYMLPPTVQRAEQIPEEASGVALED